MPARRNASIRDVTRVEGDAVPFFKTRFPLSAVDSVSRECAGRKSGMCGSATRRGPEGPVSRSSGPWLTS